MALLGTKPLKLLVLGFSLPDELFANVAGDVLGHYWRHTLTKAIAARGLCENVWKRPGDEAFIAGLLDDLGMLALIGDLPETYVPFVQKALSETRGLAPLERETLGFEHTELSARLLRNWGLPEALTEAIAAPKDTDWLRQASGEKAYLPQVLHLAELLAQLVAEHRILVLPELLEAGEAYHGLKRADITALVEDLEEKVVGLAEILSLQLPGDLSYRDMLDRAYEQLSAVAEDAAADLAQVAHERGACEAVYEEARQLSAAAREVIQAGTRVEAKSAVGRGRNTDVEQSNSSQPVARPATATSVQNRSLLNLLQSAVAECRESRRELSLLMVDVDANDQLIEYEGKRAVRRLKELIDAAVKKLEHKHAVCLPIDQGRYAVVLPRCDRQFAVQLAGQLRRDLPIAARDDFSTPITISIGSATVSSPAKNFVPAKLTEAAERCLFAAHAAGGDSVKSIEIY